MKLAGEVVTPRNAVSNTCLTGAEVEAHIAHNDDTQKKQAHRGEFFLEKKRADAGNVGEPHGQPDGVGHADFDGFDGQGQAGDAQAVKNNDTDGGPLSRKTLRQFHAGCARNFKSYRGKQKERMHP